MQKPSILPVVVWGLAFVVLTGVIRGPEGSDPKGISREEMWQKKLTAPAAFNVVFAGDSRTLYDVAPQEVRAVYPEAHVLNFAFNYVGMTSQYLRATEDKLDPAAQPRIIVVGITPREFTPLNLRVSGYEEERGRSRTDWAFDAGLPGFSTFLRPITPGAAFLHLAGRMRRDQNFYADGWVSQTVDPPDNEIFLKQYRPLFRDNRISEQAVENFLAVVAAWRAKGIEVYAFRPPTIADMVEIENGTSGFDEQAFARRFTAAGGSWISVPLGHYEVSDGSHLVPADARRFSRDLGNLLGKGTSSPMHSLIPVTVPPPH